MWVQKNNNNKKSFHPKTTMSAVTKWCVFSRRFAIFHCNYCSILLREIGFLSTIRVVRSIFDLSRFSLMFERTNRTGEKYCTNCVWVWFDSGVSHPFWFGMREFAFWQSEKYTFDTNGRQNENSWNFTDAFEPNEKWFNLKSSIGNAHSWIKIR